MTSHASRSSLVLDDSTGEVRLPLGSGALTSGPVIAYRTDRMDKYKTLFGT